MEQDRLLQRSCCECGRPNTACLYRLLETPGEVNYVCSLCGKGFGGNSSNGHYHMAKCHRPCIYYVNKRQKSEIRQHRSVKRAGSKRRSMQLTGHTSIREHVTLPDSLNDPLGPLTTSPSLHHLHTLMYSGWTLLDLPALHPIDPVDETDLYPFI